MRYFVEISYNGTNYHGWQVQPNANSVQAEIIKGFSVLFRNETFECVGCGRTDTGVHAKQFYFHFDTKDIFDPELYTYKLNSILPKDISVHRIFKVDDEAHARFNAVSRTYEYYVHDRKDVFMQKSSCFWPVKIDVDQMNQACETLLNYDDFTSFSKVHSDAYTNICDISKAIWTKEGHQYKFEITANRFLRNMVRAVVGTTLQVGEGKISVDDFKAIVEAKDRGQAGKSVHGHGLYLSKISYPFIED